MIYSSIRKEKKERKKGMLEKKRQMYTVLECTKLNSKAWIHREFTHMRAKKATHQ